MPAYQYQPLGSGQIRLIELFPNTHGDGLTGRLHAVMLRDYNAADDDDDGIKNTQQFEALSYVWGSDTKPCILTTPDAGALPMTASLHSFFLRLRLADRPRMLWADGICINQADAREKEQQVQLMAGIYRSARGVVADLGPGDDSTYERLVQFIKSYWCIAVRAGGHPGLFGRALSPHEAAVFLGISPPPKGDVSQPLQLDHDDSASMAETVPSAQDEIWEQVVQLFDSPWFQRLWIVQEFILARNVVFYYGTSSSSSSSSTFDWRDLFAFIIYYNTATEALQTQFMTIWASEELQTHPGIGLFSTMAYQRGFRHLQATASGRELLDSLTLATAMRKMRAGRWVDLLQWYRLCGCTLQRDRYYALLSIASDIDAAAHPELRPDYRTPDAELKLKIGKFLIQHRDGSEAFMRAGLATQSDHGAPSWMQSFARFRLEDDGGGGAGDLVSEQLALNNDHMAAGPDSEFHVKLVDGWDDAICVQGYKVDDVLGVSKQAPSQIAQKQDISLDERVCDYICGAFQMFSARIEARHVAPEVVVDRQCLEAMVTTLAAGTWDTQHTRDMSALVLGLFLVLNLRRGQFDGFKNWRTVLLNILRVNYGHGDVLSSSGRVAVSDELVRHAIVSLVGHIYLPYITGIKGAITREGPFANVPAATEPGDELWIISGCRLPVVLRRSYHRKDMYRLVGVCYAHGVMDGSVLLRDGFAFRDVIIY